MPLDTVCIKTEVEDVFVKEEADSEDLYKLYEDHQVKDELVLGPVLIHRPHAASIQVNTAEPAEPRGRACSVRLERLLLDTERGACRVGHHTYKLRAAGAVCEDTGGVWVKEDTYSVGSCNLFQEQVHDVLVPGPVLIHQHQVSSVQASVSRAEPAGCWGRACSVRLQRLLPGAGRGRRTGDTSEPQPPQHSTDTSSTTANYELSGSKVSGSREGADVRERLVRRLPRRTDKSLLITHLHAHSLGPARNSIREEFSLDCPQTIHTRKHRTTDTGDKPFKCGYCDFRSCNKRYLREHEMTHTGDRPVKCNHCNYKCNHNSYLQIHLRIHTGDKPFMCGYCDYRCRHKQSLRTHEMRHTGEKPFKCNHCDYKCNNNSSLRIHLRVHTGEKPYKCRDCDYRCRQIQHLRTHEKIHTNEKPFKCNQCKHKTRQKSHLRIHMRIHTGEKPFRCKYCDFRSRHRGHLRSHEMIHTGEKPFKCNHCEYKCNQSSALLVHLRTHTGKKPFQCGYCDYRSRDRRCLRTHEMKHTEETPFK